MKKLTKPEEQIMKHLWKLEKAFLKDIVKEFSEPRPAYTTISTVIGVLVKKKFIGYRTIGKSRQYYPRIKKNAYLDIHIKDLVGSFFNGSSSELASFFTKSENLDLTELVKMRNILEDKIKDLEANNE